ncbi:MAG: TldD/PmbA family protein [Candidatus Polarisedimenticolia bacterium]
MIGQDLAAEVLRAALARGGDGAELYLEKTSSMALKLDGGRIEDATAGVDQGAGLSLIDRDRTLYANGNGLDADALMRLADKLARAQGASHPQTPEPVAVSAPPIAFEPRPLHLVSPVITPASTVSVERKVDIVRRADAAARAFDPRVTQVTVQYRDTEQHVLVADSDGSWGSEIRCHVVLHVTAVARQGEDIRTGMEARSETRGFEFFDRHLPEDIAREAARQAVLQLSARPAPSGSFTVVLSSKAGGTMVHEACGHGLEADFILKSMSVYSGKVGQQVASPLLTVVDDGTLPNRRGSSSMDDEGIPTTRAVLIDKGVLRGFLHTRRTARLLKMRPTGHGRRESYRHLPIPRMRNTLILPGERSAQSILAEVKDGILVCRMGGGEVDVASGNFVFSCSEAYRIRDGRIAEPIRDATLIGNGPEVMKSIDRVGTDLGFGVGTCGKEGQGVPVSNAQPTLRIPRITVGGTATA